MKWFKDGLLLLVISLLAYGIGRKIGQSTSWRDWLLEGQGASLTLMVDSIDFQEDAFEKLGAGAPTMALHWLTVKTEEGFKNSSPISDGAFVRVNWIEKSDRQPLPLYKMRPQIDEQLSTYFRRDKFRSAQILPLLWGVPAIKAPANNTLPLLKVGVHRTWPFLPIQDFFGSAPAESPTSPIEWGIWNALAQSRKETEVLQKPPGMGSSIILGLVLFDTPQTRKPGTVKWVESLLKSPVSRALLQQTGLGLTFKAEGVPTSQTPDFVSQFELKQIN